ncbi:MAG TPA: YihY/virulence factor BrkB family protein [Micromonosporaceae bacterium]|jgi:membrane protein
MSDTDATTAGDRDQEIAGRTDDRTSAAPTAQDGPTKLSALGKQTWLGVLKRTFKQVSEDKLTTWAAALTYYGILSMFPGLLVLIAALRLTGESTTQHVLRNVTAIAPGPAQSILTSAIQNLQQGQSSTAGVLAIVGVLGALWSASGYVGSFMQAANSIYDVPEGRPIWKKLPTRLGITVVAGVIVGVAALMVVFTGSLARQLGDLIGLGSTAVTVWDIAKWPVLVILISLLFALLYWAGPNAKHGGFRWITPGSMLAVVLWIAASAGFALYVANFSSYNKTYGSLAAVIVFLVWLWITNLAILFGAEFDAEMQRGRAIEAGRAADDEPYMALRDTAKIDPHANADL